MSLIERIFPNVSRETFLAKHWLYEPLHFQGSLDRFHDLLDVPVFASVDEAIGMDCRARRLDSPDQEGDNYVQHNFHPSVEECRRALDEGKTVYMGGLQLPPFPALNDQLATELELPLALEGLYLERFWLAFAAKPSKGLRWHWDRHHLLIIQIHGKKRFKLAKNRFFSYPNVPPVGYDSWLQGMSPTLCGALGRSTMSDADLPVEHAEIVLEAGDALFMPAGLWHSAETLEDSLHVGYAVKVPTVPEILHSQLVLMNEAFDRSFHAPVARASDFEALCHSQPNDDSPMQQARRRWFEAMAVTMKKYADDEAFAGFLQRAVADLSRGAFSTTPRRKA